MFFQKLKEITWILPIIRSGERNKVIFSLSRNAGNYHLVKACSCRGKKTSKSLLISVNVVQALFWSDEFDSPGAPSSAKWGYDTGAGGWGNNELQYYTNRTDNAIVTPEGALKITLKKESYQGSPYTSARLLTKGKFSFKYGKIEIRAKLPAGGGTWPAIWMLGDNISTEFINEFLT